MSHLFSTSFDQDVNVGLSGFASDKVCLLTHAAKGSQVQRVHEVLKVPVIGTTIAGTHLVGAFCAGNDKAVLVPQIIFDSELALLEKHKVPVQVIETEHTALGNNIVANERAALISSELKKVKSDIKDALGVEDIKVYDLQDITTIGSFVVLNKKGCLLSSYASLDDKTFMEEFFGVPVLRGTVNLGSPHVRSGVIANSHGFVFGDRTGGPEAVFIDEALGFLRK